MLIVICRIFVDTFQVVGAFCRCLAISNVEAIVDMTVSGVPVVLHSRLGNVIEIFFKRPRYFQLEVKQPVCKLVMCGVL